LQNKRPSSVRPAGWLAGWLWNKVHARDDDNNNNKITINNTIHDVIIGTTKMTLSNTKLQHTKHITRNMQQMEEKAQY